MSKIYGQCSCGTVKFEFDIEELLAYQCHCSICRKISGTAYTTTLMAPEKEFVWVRGLEFISSYAKDNGYKTSFCSRCGSPVPNKFRDFPLYSVPVGCLDGIPDITIVAKIYFGSKAKWDEDQFSGKRFSDMPSLSDMLGLLHVQTKN